MIYTPDEFLKTDFYSRNIAIIGRGEGNTKYQFNPETVLVIAINDSCIFYPNSEYSFIVKAHFDKNYPIVKDIVPNIVKFEKKEMMKFAVVTGCTPSITISFLLKTGKLTGKNIYLQGFPLKGDDHDPKWPYDFQRQEKALKECFIIAAKNKINMKFVTPCCRMPGIYHAEPDNKDIILF